MSKPEQETEKERKEYGRGSASMYGYVVEWRLIPGSEVLADVIPNRLGEVGVKWGSAGYSIDDLAGIDGSRIVRPIIPSHDKQLSDHSLVSKDVAVAILFCLKTNTQSKVLKHVEWRISRIKLETSHTLTRDDNDKEHEERMNEFRDIIEEF